MTSLINDTMNDVVIYRDAEDDDDILYFDLNMNDGSVKNREVTLPENDDDPVLASSAGIFSTTADTTTATEIPVDKRSPTSTLSYRDDGKAQEKNFANGGSANWLYEDPSSSPSRTVRNSTFCWEFDAPSKKPMILIVEDDEGKLNSKNAYDVISKIKFVDDRSQVVEEFGGISLKMLSILDKKHECIRYSCWDHRVTEWLFPLHSPPRNVSKVFVKFERPLITDRVRLEFESDYDDIIESPRCIRRCGIHRTKLDFQNSLEYELPLPSTSLYDVIFVIRYPFTGYNNISRDDLVQDVIINDKYKVRSIYMTHYYLNKYYARDENDIEKNKKLRNIYVIPTRILREGINSLVIRFRKRAADEHISSFLDVLFRKDGDDDQGYSDVNGIGTETTQSRNFLNSLNCSDHDPERER